VALGGSTTKTIVVSYRGIPHARGWAAGDNLVRAFRRLGHTVYAYGNYHQTTERIEDGPLPERADLLFYVECNDEDPQYEELRSYPADVRAYWDFDVDNNRNAESKRLIRRMRFDVVFHANRLYQNFFQKLAPRAVFLPYGFDDEHFYPIDKERTIDVGLVGAAYPERVAYLERLAALGAHVQVVNGVYAQELAEVINDLKIHLNLNIDSRGGDGLLVLRIWETLGCGRLLLTQRKDFIDELFEDGEHLVLFEDAEDCAAKIKDMLARPDELERIARSGYEHALRHHTYLARAETILASTAGLPLRQPLLRRVLERWVSP
jgi:spore maturation protein CgeB